MNILVVAAHPDDEVLGCGGTMARLAQAGNDVYVLILGEGATSRHSERNATSDAETQALHSQSRAACAVLSVREVAHAGLPDNRFDTLPLLDVVKIVEAEIERVDPIVVYTHHGGDLNIDHAVTHRAVLTATRPLPGSTVREVRAFEVASSTEWAFGRFDAPFRPNVFVEIDDTLGLKIQAMAIYESESRPFPHPRSPEALRAIAQRWGSTAGLSAAEAFELIRRME